MCQLTSVARLLALQEHTSQVSRCIQDDTLEERLQIQFFGDMRRASVKLDGKVLGAKVGRVCQCNGEGLCGLASLVYCQWCGMRDD